ncbi:head maturation protease, ClpP-related [Corynebacterium auriscanis]|uniref:head maturation protease, ClpP-related n=1 Tax=Corynebacterium auriscanis TaxID=99807 RepID=UPI003CF0F193
MTEILIYGTIGVDPWDIDNNVTAKSVMEQLPESGPVTVRISSGGGDVYAGIDIMNELRRHDGEVTIIVESLAASAASFIAVGAADRLFMREESELMIHKSWTWLEGNADEVRRKLADLDRQDVKIAQIYAGRAGGETAEWLDRMAEETWYTAAEAVEAGLADAIEPARAAPRPGVEARVANRVFAKFKYACRSEAPAPPITSRAESGSEETMRPSDGRKKEDALSIENLAQELGIEPEKLRNKLSGFFNEEVTVTSTVDVTYPEGSTVVPTGDVTVTPEGEIPPGIVFSVGDVPEGWTAEVDEATGVVKATAPSGAEPDTEVVIPVTAEGNDQPVELSVVVTVKAAASGDNAPAAPAGEPSEAPVTLDAETYAELRNAAQFGWKAMEEQKLAKLDAEVDEWIRDGRIPAARRAKAMKTMHTDPELARDLYGSNPKNTVPLTEIGTGKNPNAESLGESQSLLRAKADKLGFLSHTSFH